MRMRCAVLAQIVLFSGLGKGNFLSTLFIVVLYFPFRACFFTAAIAIGHFVAGVYICNEELM
jgi:hypothetical protein